MKRGAWLGIAAAALSLCGSLALAAQNPPADQAPQAPPPSGQSQKPAEKPPEQNPPSNPPLKLETPPTEAPPPAQAAPPKAAPQNLQLETPKPTAPAPPAAQTPAGPPTIQEINFHGNRRIVASSLRARIFTHRGDVYDEDALGRDLHALWNTGYFDDIRVESSDGATGKIIDFYLREKKLVRSIDYKGLSTVQESDVLDEFKKRKVGLSIQSQYDPVVIKRAEVVLQDMLSAHGKMFATVHHRTRNIPPNSVALTFIVVEGPKVKVGYIHFTGNHVFSADKLVRAMKYSRPVGAPPWFYWFHKTYDKERIQADLENIRDLYRDDGYFYALPKEPETKMVDTRNRWPFFFWSWGHGKRVDLTIPIDEGLQYRLGKFVIRGNKLFKQEQLARVLPLKPGDVFSLSKVRKAIENYTKLYGVYGYINFTASPDIEPDNKRRLINLALDFEEDKQFFVHRIEFSGNTKTRDKVIRRELLLDEGNIFSSNLWDLSIYRVNQLGYFDEIKKEDYDIKQNTKEGNVDITVKVKERGRNSIGFSGGISGLAGNFIGANYATNNFLGLGETLSLQAQWGTFQKLYSFGFTEPYLMDRPIQAGFTVFKSDYRYDQLRQLAAYTGISPSSLALTSYGQLFTQNFRQNSSGFTVFTTTLLHRTFARVGVTYSFTRSDLSAFSAASQAFFEAINFRGLAGPSALTGITSSSIMPTYLYNTVNDAWNPTRGRYMYAAVAFSGSFIGGNVNTVTPTFEYKYFRPVRHKTADHPQAIGLRFLASAVSGYGGLVPPPFQRFYMGGEQDLRGFDIRTVSPVAFYPTVIGVCNRDNFGNPILATGPTGRPTPGSCGSTTNIPIWTPIFPGGDTEVLGNFEYRIPIAGPVTLSYFIDAGMPMILRPDQLKIVPSALSQIETQYPYFPIPSNLKPISSTNIRPRVSSGLDLQVIVPVINAPFHLFYGYNVLRLNETVTPPQGQSLPPESVFPNLASYEGALKLFGPFRILDRSGKLGFTVTRTF